MVMLKRSADTLEPISVAAGAADSDATYFDVVPKEPTPLLGSWADVWSSRQASEIIIEDAEKDAANKALAAAEQEPQPSDADTAMSPAASFSSEGSGAPLEDAARLHARHVYRHDPYGTEAARTDIFVCTCTACVTAHVEAHAEIERRRAAARVPPYALIDPAHAAVAPTAVVEPPSPIKLGASADSASEVVPVQRQQPTPAQRGGFLTHSHVPPPPPHAPRAEVIAFPTSRAAAAPAYGYEAPALPPAIPPHMLSAFMPPPPPSTMTAAVLERDGTHHAHSFVEHVALRWHAKVAATQLYFVAPEDACPEPAGRNFDEWLQECADWWFRHFEFAQMKPTVYAAAHYGAPAYGGIGGMHESNYYGSDSTVPLQEVW